MLLIVFNVELSVPEFIPNDIITSSQHNQKYKNIKYVFSQLVWLSYLDQPAVSEGLQPPLQKSFEQQQQQELLVLQDLLKAR